MPIRRMSSQAKVNSDGYQRSYKHPLDAVAMIDAESDNELTFLMFAEVDPTVSFIVAQPTRLTFTHADRIASHFPDYALIRRGAAELHEIKSSSRLERSDTINRLIAAGRHVENWTAWSYFVTGSAHLLEHPSRDHVQDLWRHHRRNYNDLQLRAVLDVLGTGEKKIADLLTAMTSMATPLTEQGILSMAAGCRLFIDMAAPIGIESYVRRPDMDGLPASLLPSVRPEEIVAWR